MCCRYLVTTLSVVPRGTEGAVSVEGTVAGVVAAIFLAAAAFALGQVREHVPVSVLTSSLQLSWSGKLFAIREMREDLQCKGGHGFNRLCWGLACRWINAEQLLLWAPPNWQICSRASWELPCKAGLAMNG